MNARSMMLGVTWVLGCAPVVDLNDDESSGGSQGTSSTSATTFGTSLSASGATAATIGSADDTLDDADTRDSVGFIDCGAAPPGSSLHCLIGPEYCDLGLQDCAPGDKCNPWSAGGDQWTDALCVPLDDTPAVTGEPCTIMGSPWSGLDDCGLGMFCLPQDARSLTGTCWELCSTVPDGVVCDTGTCVVETIGLELQVCEPACDPVLQDCAYGPCDAGGEPFACEPTLGPGAAVGEACDGGVGCEVGATCLDADSVPGCASAACCAAYCDRLAPDPELACGEGLACTDWFEPGTAPAGYEHVGVCVAG